MGLFANTTAAAPSELVELAGRFDDEPLVETDLPVELVDALLLDAGWRIAPEGESRCCFVLPGGRSFREGGRFGHDYLWNRGAAVRLLIIDLGLRVSS